MSKTFSPLMLGTLGAAAVGFSLPAAAAVVTVDSEAIIRSQSPDEDISEANRGAILIKFDEDLSSAGKGYFQFDLTGQNADLSQGGTLTFPLARTFDQAINVFALDQAYPEFDSSVTYNSAQANDLDSNDLLTSGEFTATQIGGVREIEGDDGSFSVELASLAPFVFDDLITIALTGAAPVTEGFSNDAGGLRVALNSSTLTVSEVPEPASLALFTVGGVLLLARKRRNSAA